MVNGFQDTVDDVFCEICVVIVLCEGLSPAKLQEHATHVFLLSLVEITNVIPCTSLHKYTPCLTNRVGIDTKGGPTNKPTSS